ncbi:MAG: hypothetical protein KDI51_01425 [Xanthomonadales bacterium]|nr:hypothetical protein [Xanthomonadales bacterium]
MYGRIFRSIYDGTLADNWQALVTFQQLLVLCDQHGVVDMTPGAIARTTGIPVDIIRAGLDALEAPDPSSRTPAEEGRRIVRLDDHRDWGWRIVNFSAYRAIRSAEDKREADRKRIAGKRATERECLRHNATDCDTSQSVAKVAHTATEKEPEKAKSMSANADTDSSDTQPRPQCRFSEFWAEYPKKEGKKPALQAWQSKRLDRIADQIIADVRNRREHHGQWLAGFIPLPATYLRQERWSDEISRPPPKTPGGNRPEGPPIPVRAL